MTKWLSLVANSPMPSSNLLYHLNTWQRNMFFPHAFVPGEDERNSLLVLKAHDLICSKSNANAILRLLPKQLWLSLAFVTIASR